MRKLTTEEFIDKAREIHGDWYDYSKVKYVNNSTKVIIICPIHGEFEQKPSGHLSERGCKHCGIINRTSNTNQFIEKAKEVHGDRYDYSKVEYEYDNVKVTITCSIHGDFEQKPNDHLTGKGCKKCGYAKNSKNKKSNTQYFIEKGKSIHGNKYDYSKVEYINSYTKVTISCPEHGDFEQKPNDHLNRRGCPKCGRERVGFWNPEYIRKYRNELKDSPCTLYIIDCYLNHERFVKVGITLKTVEERYHHESLLNGYQYTTLYEYQSTLLGCSEIEQEILKHFKDCQYTPLYKFEGASECFEYKKLQEIVGFIENAM